VVEKIGPGRGDREGGAITCGSSLHPLVRAVRGTASAGQPTIVRAWRDKPRWFMLDGTSRFRAQRAAAPPFSCRWRGMRPHAVLARAQRDPDPRGMPPLDVGVGLVSCGVAPAGAGTGNSTGPRCRRGPSRGGVGARAGRRGLNTIQAARLLGAGKDHRGGRDAPEARLGRGVRGDATLVDASKEDPVAAGPEDLGGRRRRLHLRGWWAPRKTIEQAVLATHRGGTCVIVGVSPAGTRGLARSVALPAAARADRLVPSGAGTSARTCRC